MLGLIEIRFFGYPQVHSQGQPLASPLPHKAMALLAYLALEGQPVGRETLATLLWPDAPVQTAKHSLRNQLSVLRKVMGDGLVITPRTLALSALQRQQIDVVAFGQGLTAAKKAQQQGHAPDLLHWQAAVDLYCGDFLEGFYVQQSEPFDEWTTLRREYLRQQLFTHLLALSAAYAARTAHEAALACLDRLLALDPENEAAYQGKIKSLLALGRRTEALQCYERYQQLLTVAFAMHPAPALTALVAEARTQADSPAAPLYHKQAHQNQGSLQSPVNRGTPPVSLSAMLPLPKLLPQPTIPTNLAHPLSAFVGRTSELAELAQRFADTDCRLLTIVGPGGMGKTALALAFGRYLLETQGASFPDGIFWVPLLDIDAADHNRAELAVVDETVCSEAILRAIAEQIGYKLEAGESPAVQLQTYLRTRKLLLILDNFEHLLAGSSALIKLLAQAPQLKVLITSRARLNVRGESVLTLAKLSLPTAAYYDNVNTVQAHPTGAIRDEVWQASEAVKMFLQRARQFDPAFTMNAATVGPVGRICDLVEGLPLGIELATSMLPMLNCRSLAEELAKSLDFLVSDIRDLPHDQRTLSAVFERSWRLLPPEGQQLLAKLAIFPGSFSRDAAVQVAGASIVLLRRLLDQSLLNEVGDDRYVMHRTVHAFAQQKLQQWPAQSAPLQMQYADFYLNCVARLEHAPTEQAYATASEQIQLELDNIRTAWRWSVDQGDLALLTLGVGGLQSFYRTAGIYPEAIQLLEAAMPTVRQVMALEPMATHPQRLLARLLCYTAEAYRFYRRADTVEKAESCANEALELGRRLADPALQALAYHILARLAQRRVDFAAMCQMAAQACVYARQANLPHLLAENLNNLGIGVGVCKHPLAGTEHFLQGLACLQQQPNLTLEARIVANLGMFHTVGHAYQSAYEYFQQRRTLPSQDREGNLITQITYGDLWVALGDYTAAQEEYTQALALAQTRHAPYWEGWLHASLGRLQRLCGDLASAQSTARFALQIARKDVGRLEQQWALIELGHVLTDLDDFVAAASCYQQAIALPTDVNWFFRTPDAYAGLAAVALAQNEITSALVHAEAALTLLTQQGLAAAGEPFAVYWTCVRVLGAAGDPRMQPVLVSAYQQLQEIANQLEDERLRRSFLENVVVNRQLVAAAQTRLPLVNSLAR